MVNLILLNRQPLPDDEPPQEEGQVQGQDQGEQEEMPSENYCDFSIFITSSDGTGLVVEATTMDTEISLNNVMVRKTADGQKQINRYERSLRTYGGPDFSTLDERIQSSLTEYLEGFGVNEHLAAFIECMSLDKD